MRARPAVLFSALVAAAVIFGPVLAYQTHPFRLGKAAAYDPRCEGDWACDAWANFRRSHPFPYQSIQGKRLPDGKLAILIFEPPPVMTKPEFDKLARTAFGEDLESLRRFRWKIGADGWLEDVVLTVATPPDPADPLEDPVFRDRIAFLHLALFRTTFGSSLELHAEAVPAVSKSAAPNLKVSPREVKQWLAEPALRWSRLDADGEIGPVSWQGIATQRKTGTFISADRSLVLLTFPGQILRSAQSSPDVLEPLRGPFRCFAVSTDGIVGGYQAPNGHLAILGRRRTQTFTSAPPLRFETFAMLASQGADELSQSYERNALFAGKLRSGQFRGLDWAPIYLSDALIDTEFGALLNITDQLLKSWSEAGNVEYLYFTYGKPDSFPFSGRPLSTVVKEQSGSGGVLYNWNTAGSAVVVANAASKVLTPRQTGALPVTYGAEAGELARMETGTLLKQEEQAYDYFANRKDANLQRVVQYTLLYQFCRAVLGDAPAPAGKSQPAPVTGPGMRASRAAAGVRVQATAHLLEELEGGRFSSSRLVEETQQKLRAVRKRYPTYTTQQLASILSDRFSEESKQAGDERIARLRAMDALATRAINEYNALVRKYNAAETEFTQLILRQELDKRKLEIDRLEKNIEAARKDDIIGDLRAMLRPLARMLGDPEQVRAHFVASHAYEPYGSIKTPSIVVSWDSVDVDAVGGHNIDARALRLEPSTSVTDMTLVRTDKGLVLRYNPAKAAAVEARASELARAVEHGGVRDASRLSRIVRESPAAPPRARSTALELPRATEAAQAPETWSAQMGKRVFTTKLEFVDDVRLIAEKNECCVFVAYDKKGVAYATERNPKPPPGSVVHEIRDTPSMNEFLTGMSRRDGAGSGRSVVFFDTPESHVNALALNVSQNTRANLAGMAESLGARRMGGTEATTGGIATRDFAGRTSVLRTVTRAAETRIKALFSRIASPEPPASWKRVEVSVLERPTAERFVAELGWRAEDGIPAAVSLRFNPPAQAKSASGRGLPPVDVSVTVGFADADYNAGRAHLVGVHERNLRLAAAAREASIAQYATTVRNELQQLLGIKLRRLTVIVQEGENRTLLSFRMEDAHESRRPG